MRGVMTASLLAYVIRRMLALALVVTATTALVFLLSRLIPGDPARVAAGQDATPQMVQQLRARLGLDRPLPIQYGYYVRHLIEGDLGVSIGSQRPVIDALKQRLPATLELTLTSLLLSTTIGIPLGLLAATRRGRVAGVLGQLVPASLVSAPVFWVGMLLQFLFYRQLGLLPDSGRMSSLNPIHSVTGFLTIDAVIAGNWNGLMDIVKHLILPAVVLTNVSLPIIARVTAASVMEVLAQQFVTTARSKGLSERFILIYHVLRNAAIPMVTVLGLRLGDLMAGAVLVETIFAWPGIGRYAVEAIDNLDYPAIMGFVLFAAATYAFINLVVDLLYFWLDPTISIPGSV
jgi:peptide/nickel transport system permease protein